ncbi:MAG: hypothetical protein JNM14_06085 [Ferruginibacter sp.]|nr:hypothetical protein [Ferruginibacter sp.]
MKKAIAATAVMLVAAIARAQPSATQVKNDFMGGGVIAVEGIVINKEWYKDHYLWKASFRTVLPVKPEEVDGLKGVTLVRHVVAHYECTGSCGKTWSGLAYTEYRGINLPAPSNAEINQFLKNESTANPSSFFRSMSGKFAITETGVNEKEPKFEWLNPRKLTFKAWKKNYEEVSYNDVALVQTPLTVTLKRDGLKLPWKIDFIQEERESLEEIKRIPKSEMKNLVAGSDAGEESKIKAEADRLHVPAPPLFITAEAAASDFYTMLFNLSREQFKIYVAQMMNPEMRCYNCKYTLNGNGQPKVDYILKNAYDGPGLFKDQFCMTPSFSIEGSAVYFKNKEAAGMDSYIMLDKVGSYYYINSATLQVSKDAATNTKFKSISCGSNDGAAGMASETQPKQGGWKKGDKVLVEENGKWYPATVLDTRPGEWFIHYDGYASKYDLWVNISRIKNK